MAGCVIPRTPIAVDFWKRRNTPQAKLFFLSHMHSDHTEGLSSSWNQKIYCSEITKSLAIDKFKINPSLIFSIPVGQSTILNLDEIGVEKLTVTLIDANHCPGAVMFLFEGYFGRILYTGDFRYFEGMLDISPLDSHPIINTLFLDNTYCDPACDFPTRAEATLMILDILRRHPSEDIVFGMNTLGKEDLLYKIALVLGVHIVVDEYRYQTTKLLGYNEVFTTDANASHVRVVGKHHINRYNVSLWNKEHPTIAILPTCLYKGSSSPFDGCEKIFVVPYSDHSSFPEMKNFVACVKPQQIIPIVKSPRRFKDEDCNSRMDMSVFAQQKSTDRVPHIFDIPQSVKAFMSQHPDNALTFSSISKKRKSQSFFHNKSKKPCGVVFPSPKKDQKDVKTFKGDLSCAIIPLTKANSESSRPVLDDNLSNKLLVVDSDVLSDHYLDGAPISLAEHCVEGVSVATTKSSQNKNAGSNDEKHQIPGIAYEASQFECKCECEGELYEERGETHHFQEALYEDLARTHHVETNGPNKPFEELEETAVTATEDHQEELLEEREKMIVNEIHDSLDKLGENGGETNSSETLDGEDTLSEERNETPAVKTHPVNPKDEVNEEQDEIHATETHERDETFSENQKIQVTESRDSRETLCEEQKEFRAMGTSETLPNERHNESETFDVKSCERYCLRRTKERRSSNIYGGSCAFALQVIEKLKANRQSI